MLLTSELLTQEAAKELVAAYCQIDLVKELSLEAKLGTDVTQELA